ncbi:MAG: hypothetical protein P8J45_08675 [Phycisphaerales bacterium]|jgi:hypothetical protein|nr:hypothetical protein [Phycisphaerales bacterium]
MTAPDPQFEHLHPAQVEQASSPELSALIKRLDDRGEVLRTRPGLTKGIISASLDELPAPVSYDITRSSSTWVVGRIALAAGLLIAFAVAARMLLAPAVQPLDEKNLLAATASAPLAGIDSILPTESDTVLVTLLDAGRNGQIQNIGGLEGSDPVGAAFAPILGTTGIDFDDYLAEISLIEVELRR